MWLFAPSGGFYSAVQDLKNPDLLRIRCRDHSDAEHLVTQLADEGLVIEEDLTADYRYRVLVHRAVFAAWVAVEALGIDYGNYKDAVKNRMGAERAWVYGGVWGELLDLQPSRPWSGIPFDFHESEALLLPPLPEDDPLYNDGVWGDDDPRVSALRLKPSRRRTRRTTAKKTTRKGKR